MAKNSSLSRHGRGLSEPDPALKTPRDAICEMVAAGAVFTVRHRTDGLGPSFTYEVTNRGDLDRCRGILASVKSRPAPFYEAFKAAVQHLSGGLPHA